MQLLFEAALLAGGPFTHRSVPLGQPAKALALAAGGGWLHCWDCNCTGAAAAAGVCLQSVVVPCWPNCLCSS